MVSIREEPRTLLTLQQYLYYVVLYDHLKLLRIDKKASGSCFFQLFINV